MIEIVKGKFISEEELVFKASRSSGPGGQNINKVNTRITLLFDVANCKSLSGAQKQQVQTRLATRVDKKGVIRIVSQKYRTQKANRKAAVERLQQLLKDALRPKPIRKKTKVTYAAKQQRLNEKRQRSLLKQQRTGRNWAGDLVD